jgi:hypothetical protein
MIRSTAYLHLRPELNDAERAALVTHIESIPLELDLLALQVSAPTRRSRGAGDLMVLAAFADIDSAEAARSHRYVTSVIQPLLDSSCRAVEVVRYQQGPVQIRQPGLAGGIQRTLAVSVEGSVDRDTLSLFESQLAAMGQFIDEIRNCSLSKVDDVVGGSGPRWDYIWEQEFHSIDDVTGPYMDHPYHWAIIDPWFDPQSPTHILRERYLHSVCRLESSILTLVSQEDGADTPGN